MKLIRTLSMLLLLFTVKLSAQCSGNFTWSASGSTVTFMGTVTMNVTLIGWDFGDGNYDYTNSISTSHSYANPGSYTACILVSDSITCADSTCHSVVVPAGGCNADFTWVDSLGYVFFINGSSLGNSGVYFWDFGDGNYSNQANPSNVYAFPGLYMVCLTAYDSSQNFCDSTCYFLQVNPNTGLNENKTNITAVSLSPNPSDAAATVAFSMAEPGNALISVFDLTGREISSPFSMQLSSGKQQTVINTQEYAPGIYIVQVTVNGQSVKSRLVVTHKQ